MIDISNFLFNQAIIAYEVIWWGFPFQLQSINWCVYKHINDKIHVSISSVEMMFGKKIGVLVQYMHNDLVYRYEMQETLLGVPSDSKI